MDQTNNTIVESVNDKLQKFTKLYFDNINYNMAYAEYNVESDAYSVLGMGVPNVHINLLNKEVTKLSISATAPVTRSVARVEPLVRIQLTMEDIMEFDRNSAYLRASITGVIHSVQKSWEQQFGSYKLERFGGWFFRMEPLRLVNDEVYLDFTGKWADPTGNK